MWGLGCRSNVILGAIYLLFRVYISEISKYPKTYLDICGKAYSVDSVVLVKIQLRLCFACIQLEYAASVGDAKSKESREAEKKRILSLIDRF